MPKAITVRLDRMSKRADPSELLAFARRMELTIEALGFERKVDFARSIGETKGRVQNWVTGASFIGYDAMMKLHRIHGVDPNWLFLGRESGLPGDFVARLQQVRAKVAEKGEN